MVRLLILHLMHVECLFDYRFACKRLFLSILDSSSATKKYRDFIYLYMWPRMKRDIVEYMFKSYNYQKVKYEHHGFTLDDAHSQL